MRSQCQQDSHTLWSSVLKSRKADSHRSMVNFLLWALEILEHLEEGAWSKNQGGEGEGEERHACMESEVRE